MTATEERAVESPVQATAGPGVIVSLLRIVLLPSLGALLGFVLLTRFVLPVIGFGSVERIVQLGQHLDAKLLPAPVIAFLGNSITREGVDTRLVEATAPTGWHAQNLAISGCGLSEIRMLLPKTLAAQPTAVAIGFSPEYMGQVDKFDIDIDKAYAYALGGFVTAWPRDWTRADFPGVSEQTYAALRSNRFEQDLHFRTALLNEINLEVRLLLRRDELRRTAPNNWIDPYELEFNVRDERLPLHVDSIRRGIEAQLAGGTDPGSKLIATLAEEVRRSDAIPVLIMLPMHPLLRDGMQSYIAELHARLTQIAQQQLGIMIDAVDLLPSDEFADALHPNAAGRDRYSRFLGQQLVPLGTASHP
jgi:hypothetical protein